MVRGFLRLVCTSGVLLAALLLIGHASAHPGHLGEDAPVATAPAALVHGERSDVPQVRADRSCPDDSSGSCCCTEQAAHAPSQAHALPPRRTDALAAPRSPSACVVVVSNDVPASLPPLIGSRGSRGPPRA